MQKQTNKQTINRRQKEKIYQLIDPEVTHVVRLVNKDINIVIKNILHIWKKIKGSICNKKSNG